eukprot:scaffold547_cov143-Skeletonema_menzelii.AAC.10
MSSPPLRSSQRVTQVVNRFADEQAKMAAAAAVRKKKRQNDAISSPNANAEENKTASTADDNIDTIDGIEVYTFISKEEDDDCHESALVANFEEFNATPVNAKSYADYYLKRSYENESNANQLKQMFVKTSEESRVAATVDESGIRFNFLDQCKKLDGKSCEIRTKEGFAALDKNIRSQLSFKFKPAIQYEVSGELVPGSGEWETIHFAPLLAGKGGRHAPPNSLVKFCRGDHHLLHNLKPGESRLYRKDANGVYIFKVRVVDWRSDNRNDIEEAAKRNKLVREACFKRIDELDRLRLEHSIIQHPQATNHLYEVTKKDDLSFGVWKAKSLLDVIEITGQKTYSKSGPIQIKAEMLPADMNQDETLTTCRGTFIVKRISLERFESAELQKVTDKNKPALDAKLVMMRKLFGEKTNFSQLKFFLVEKVGNDAEAKAWGTKPFRGWKEMKGSIGGRHLSTGKGIKIGDLPAVMNQREIIETNRGEFSVKQVTLDEYLKHANKKR